MANAPPSLVLVDTEKSVGRSPVQTFFQLPTHFTDSRSPYLQLEEGVHEPSPAESLAPFHQDPSQRIVALDSRSSPYYLVIRVGALLGFLGSHEGSKIGWDEWKSHVVIPATNPGQWGNLCTWVSGCRFFSLCLTDFRVEVYDFSMRGRASYRIERVNEDFAGVRCLSSTGVRARVQLGHVLSIHSGHGSVVFSGVSVIVFFSFPLA